MQSHTDREIAAGDELTKCYEADDMVAVPFDDPVGGSYMLHDCNCGRRICCGDISSRILSGHPNDHDMFFVRECLPEKCTEECLGLDIRLIRDLNDEFCALHPRLNHLPADSILREFLVGKFQNMEKPVSEETMQTRLLALHGIQDGTMPMHERLFMN